MTKPINKTTLAGEYGWTLRFLVRKINTSPELLKELRQKTNYCFYQRIFTPIQVEIIYKHFGKPVNSEK